jgi:2-dehydropantoate 2-reductase
MKVCIFGAGAVGGHVAARMLAARIEDVAIVARGPTLAALRDRGLVLRSGGKEIAARPETVTDDPASLPPQDLVLVTLKAYAVPAAADSIARLIAPLGCAAFLVNGVPWWWRYEQPGGSASLPLVDPGEALWSKVRPERAVGCVVYSSNEVVSPGIISHSGTSRFLFGEPDGSMSARLRSVIDLFGRAGMEALVPSDLRREVLNKLVINASGNTIAALARADLGQMSADPGLRSLGVGVMREVLSVSNALGYDLSAEIDPEAVAGGWKAGVRPSMLQDTLQGKPIEVEAILGQVQAFALQHGVSVPLVDAILPLLRGLDRSLRQV